MQQFPVRSAASFSSLFICSCSLTILLSLVVLWALDKFLDNPIKWVRLFWYIPLLIFSASCLLCHPSLILFVGWMTVKRIRFGQFRRLIPSAHSCALPFQCCTAI
ncbi:hypothetical protein MTR67_030585 [Solanum verrucosum]|uniref:Uncharacterized protein n=1 Tax=Solanum verrucosum TaxID=315347 RepID=A0AAF0RCV9_SOLVR|nr:hypothetical protein MTR67_030585 [Solanum verrucosum]